jgi:hypothetical protein
MRMKVMGSGSRRMANELQWSFVLLYPELECKHWPLGMRTLRMTQHLVYQDREINGDSRPRIGRISYTKRKSCTSVVIERATANPQAKRDNVDQCSTRCSIYKSSSSSGSQQK